MPGPQSLHGLRLDDDGPIRIVTFDRPEIRNPLDLEIRYALAEVFNEAHRDPVVRAIVLTGRDGAFCSGGDLKTMRRMDRTQSEPRLQAAQQVAAAIAGGPTPVIAAVDGAAVAAGLGVALACDRIISSTTARFGAGFTGVGLAADLGVTYTLPARVGAARARSLLMFGDILNAEQAERIGLVDDVVAPNVVLSTAIGTAHRLAAGPPLALGLLKRHLAEPAADLATALDRELTMQATLIDTDDYAEGLAAAAAKRRPTFVGR